MTAGRTLRPVRSFCRPLSRLMLLLIALTLGLGAGPLSAEPMARTVIMATAPVSGVSFSAGGAVCGLVNQDRARHGVRCLIESTSGSAESLRRLRQDDFDFALVQSDWQFLAARNGLGAEGTPFKDLRAVFSLHAQAVSVVVNPRSGIKRLEDLKGRRVGLGPKGSGIRAVGEALFGALGWREGDFEDLLELGVDEQVESLCSRRIDAFVFPVSHPNQTITAAAATCGAVLIEVAGTAIDRLIDEWPFYAPARIPGQTYRGNPDPVQSYGMRTTLVANRSVPDEVVYELVKAALGKIDALKSQHAALMELDIAEMVGTANSAPLHEGALRYYREQGWK